MSVKHLSVQSVRRCACDVIGKAVKTVPGAPNSDRPTERCQSSVPFQWQWESSRWNQKWLYNRQCCWSGGNCYQDIDNHISWMQTVKVYNLTAACHCKRYCSRLGAKCRPTCKTYCGRALWKIKTI